MWYVCDVLYAVMYVHVSCFVVCGCDVSRRHIDVFNCDVFSVVTVCIDHLKLSVVCINGQMFVLRVCLLIECEGGRVTAILVWGWRMCGCGELLERVWYTWFRYCV